MKTKISKEELRELIIQHQSLSDDIDPSWLDCYKKFPTRKLNEAELCQWQIDKQDFIDYKRDWYEKKKYQLENETEEERKTRHIRFERVSERLAGLYYELVDGLLKLPKFNNAGIGEDLKMDMRQSAVSIMYKNTYKFDTRKPNPFSFMTMVAINAMLIEKINTITWRMKHVPIDFIENCDKENEDDIIEFIKGNLA